MFSLENDIQLDPQEWLTNSKISANLKPNKKMRG
jgi:hypothetical protein